jgi:F420-0:gamma-glutamyl ligase
VIITDSTCRPLRWGVTNIALSWAGFAGIVDERGKKDLYGNPLKVTQRATADALAAAAGVLTGEAAESTPFVLIRHAPVVFTKKTTQPKKFQPHDDLFAPIYTKKLRRLKI